MNRKTSAAKLLNFCRTCGHDFGGVTAFDLHRVGKHQYLHDDEHPDGRRCLTEQEMLAIGMYVNGQGRWSQPRRGLSDVMGSSTEAMHVPGSTTRSSRDGIATSGLHTLPSRGLIEEKGDT